MVKRKYHKISTAYDAYWFIKRHPKFQRRERVEITPNEAKVQDEAVTAAQRSLDLSITRYKGGVTSYLEVITAQSAALQDEVTAVNILGRRMANTVLLIQALGGGWDRSSLPERPECCGKLVSVNGN